MFQCWAVLLYPHYTLLVEGITGVSLRRSSQIILLDVFVDSEYNEAMCDNIEIYATVQRRTLRLLQSA